MTAVLLHQRSSARWTMKCGAWSQFPTFLRTATRSKLQADTMTKLLQSIDEVFVEITISRPVGVSFPFQVPDKAWIGSGQERFQVGSEITYRPQHPCVFKLLNLGPAHE